MVGGKSKNFKMFLRGPVQAESGPESGFTYLSLLLAITLMGIALSMTGGVFSTAAKREMEEELLFRGNEIRRAIGGYYESSPGAKAFPRDLPSLLKDQRYPAPKRHLRKMYTDPFTGKSDWEAIKAPDGGIMGVRSRSGKEPYKKKNFPKELLGFEDKSKYSEWEFIYTAGPVAKKGK